MHKLNYTQSGNIKNKNVIVFLHGWGCNANSFKAIQSALDDNYHTISVDFFGHGKTPHPPRALTVFDYAIAVYELLKTKKIKKVVLVGHSFGGRISIILSTVFNIKVEKLILIDSAGLKPKFNLLVKLKIIKYKIIKWLTKLKIINKNILNKFGSVDYKNLKGIQRQSFKNIVNEHLDYLTYKIGCKTLIIWGKKDKETPKNMAKKLHKRIKGSEVVFFNAGHFSYLQQPLKFKIVLKKFLGV